MRIGTIKKEVVKVVHIITRRQFLTTATLVSAVDPSHLHAEAIEGPPDSFLRKPTLHNMKPDSVSILWTLPSIVAGSVLVAAPDGSTMQFDASLQTFSSASTALPATYYQYQADVTGLNPGTAYSYEVTAGGKPLIHSTLRRALQFRTPAAADSSFHFLCFADSGDGGDEQVSLSRQMILEEDVSLVLANGDLAYDLATFASVENFYFGVYREMMAGIPFFASLGNHEYYTDHGKPSLVSRVSPSQGVPQADQGRYYSFDWGNAHFVALDSNAPLEEAAAGRGGMLRWLERDLRETRKFWRIVFFHHPGYATGKHQNEPEAARVRGSIVPILEKYGVQLVFNGHEHTYQRTRELLGGQVVPSNSGGIVYVTSGGGGATPYRVDPNNWTAVSLGENHYMRADVAGATLVLHAKGINQQDGDLDTLTLAPAPLLTGEVVIGGGTASIYGRNLCPVEFPLASAPDAPDSCTVTLESTPVTILSANGNTIRIRLPDTFAGAGTLEVTTPNGSARVQVNVSPAA